VINSIIFIGHRPLGKHSIELGSRGAKRKDFRGIMGQAKVENTRWDLTI